MRYLIIFTTVVCSLALFVSCSKVAEKAQSLKPEIREVNLAWGDVNDSSTEIIATISVYNPNPITLPVKKVSADVTMDSIKMASAETQNLQIEKSSAFPIKISAKLDNANIPIFWVEHLKRQEKSEAIIDLKAVFDLVLTEYTYPYQLKQPIETNLLSLLSKVGPIPVEKKVKIPLINQEKTIFDINLSALSGKWGNLTPENTQLKLTATVQNENVYPLPIPKITTTITLNQIPLAEGETPTSYTIAPKTSSSISVDVNLKTSLMDKWFVSHLKQGEKSQFNIKANLVFELPKEISQQVGNNQLVITAWEGNQEFSTDILGKLKL